MKELVLLIAAIFVIVAITNTVESDYNPIPTTTSENGTCTYSNGEATCVLYGYEVPSH